MSLNRAIAFDWGGVLIKNPVNDFAREISKTIKVDENDFKNSYINFLNEFERGLIPESILWQKMANLLNTEISNDHSIWYECFKKVYSPQNDVINLAKELKQMGYIIALLSNTEIPAVNYFNQLNYDFIDKTVFSCIEGFIKPHPQIYNILINKLKLRADQIIFIDDKKENVLGGQRCGIKSIQYNNYNQLINELKLADIPL